MGIDLVKRGRIKNSNKVDSRSTNLYIHLLIKVRFDTKPIINHRVLSYSFSGSCPEEPILLSAELC